MSFGVVDPRHSVTTVGTGGGWQPTYLQALLIDAAFADRERADVAFRAWCDATGFDEIDDGSFRLLPLVAHHLEQLGIGTPQTPLLRGILRRSWFEHRTVLEATLPAVDALLAAGIDVVVLKGAALGTLDYDSVGLRPIDDIDVMVREGHAQDALAVLLREGWSPGTVPLPKPTGSLPTSFLRFRHSVPFSAPNGAEVDLHWHATSEWLWPGADDGLWSATRPLTLRGREVRALAPEDELVVACVHGLRWNPLPPVRWVADALTLLQHDAIDWGALVGRANELRVSAYLVLALGILRERFGAPVPDWVVDELGNTVPASWDRQWMESLLDAADRRGLGAHYGRYLRSFPSGTGIGTLAEALPTHLVYQLGCDSVTRLPQEVGRRALRRVRSRAAQLTR